MELSDSDPSRRIVGRAPGPVGTILRKEKLCSLPVIARRLLNRPARSLLSTPTKLGPYRLRYVSQAPLSCCNMSQGRTALYIMLQNRAGQLQPTGRPRNP
jgi:hypothetical protein